MAKAIADPEEIRRFAHDLKRFNDDLESIDEGSEVVFEGSRPPLRIELEHFIDCIKTRKAPISDGRNGLAVVTVLERIMMH